jgi:hypothetical protein
MNRINLSKHIKHIYFKINCLRTHEQSTENRTEYQRKYIKLDFRLKINNLIKQTSN